MLREPVMARCRFIILAASVIMPAVAGVNPSWGGEPYPPAGYPSFRRVHEVLDYPPRVGMKVSVFGYPKCESVERCALSDAVDVPAVRLRFDASHLDAVDRLRLIHCYDLEKEQCIAVIYGRAASDQVVAERVWWRSLELP